VELEPTGERLLTSMDNSTAIEHLHRYAIAIEFTKDKIVLDIASGEGYGSNLLSKHAKKVYGVDIDSIAVEVSKIKYKSENLEFKVGRADTIPLQDNSIDVVISFETLEHHDKHEEMMKEIKRVLKADGILIISTPEKKYYSDLKNYKNPFHIKELYSNEFKKLINGYFTNTEFYFQNIFNGSLIIPEENTFSFRNFDGDFNNINSDVQFVPMYLIAIASDALLTRKTLLTTFDGKRIALKEQSEFITKIRKELKEEITKSVREEAIQWVMSSWSFRLGNTILSPFKRFRK